MTPSRDWMPGNIVEIDLHGAWGYGHVVEFPLIGFYAVRVKRLENIAALDRERFAFRLWVKKYALAKKRWPVIGSRPLSLEKSAKPWFLKKDPLTGKLTKYRGLIQPELDVTPEERTSLECAVVRNAAYVEARLLDALLVEKWNGADPRETDKKENHSTHLVREARNNHLM